MKTYVAIDIGGTSIKYGLIAENDQLIERHEMPTEAHKGGPAILEKVAEIVSGYLETVSLSGICVSSAGMVNPDKGEIFYAGPQIPNYAGTQFKKDLEARFGVPCEIENDVNCAGLAEVISGRGKGAKVAVCLTVGTGIGGCLLIDSQVFHGFSHSACEVGYLHLPDGAFQDLASTTALVRYVAEAHGDDVADWNGRRIFQEMEKGNLLCKQGVDRMVHYLAKGIANICYVANPEVVILGGGIMGQEAILKPKIQEALTANIVPSIAEKTKLVFAQHQNTAGMFGAYYHFKQRQGTRP
ncbi:ROK family protein [Streptococcus cuniculi]|uniref:ROK family protein n=1 Tax=Streptococcus cuniculi TaxID=1432788 RepID=A0A4Y9JBU4_9STRE|nr:ROK family protein [Streptococcus cuniculi]MBF0778784.1 ROK family protein [Streptococcus cuniculi]TFU97285.1 ROK family protein [Streptococcus cuniculi]